VIEKCYWVGDMLAGTPAAFTANATGSWQRQMRPRQTGSQGLAT